MDDIIAKFTNHLKTVLTRALMFAVEFEQKTIEPVHLFWALSAQKGSVASEILQKTPITEKSIRAHLNLDRSTPLCEAYVPALSESAKAIIEKAVLVASSYHHHYVGTEHLLAGILDSQDQELKNVLRELQLEQQGVRSKLAMIFKATAAFPNVQDLALTDGGEVERKEEEVSLLNMDSEEESKTPALDFFTDHLTDPEFVDGLDPVIGRETEIERVVEILSRRTKNNPILIGEPGVGKTAIVEGLAKRICEGKVPAILEGKKIHRLDMASLVAGTMYRGEFESRLRSLMDEIAEHEDVILFIDEVHTIIGAGSASGSLDAANMLKPALARGEIRCIGATTPTEYKKFIEADGALDRRFQRIRVHEPSEKETHTILLGLKSAFENFHHVSYTGEAIEAAVVLSETFLPHERFPDKAIDILDEAGAGAYAKAEEDGGSNVRAKLRLALAQATKEKNKAVRKENFLEATRFKEREDLLLQELKSHEEKRSQRKKPRIGLAEIERAVAKRAHIPLSHISRIKAPNDTLRTQLRKRIFGQDEAIDTVCKAVLRMQMGLHHPQKPRASFLFLGPTGVGKTALAEALAESLFETKEPFLHLDMSEFAEGYGISKLIGSPAGYIGYRDRNILLDHLKAHPHSVILFDEIEKAHPDILHLFLQLLDTGTVVDATGSKVNFRSSIVIFTSNVGSEELLRGPFGFHEENGSKEEKTLAKNAFTETFPREFASRIDHTCVFSPLSQKALASIAKRELADRFASLEKSGIHLSASATIAKHIAKQVKPKDGARHIRRIIAEQIENPLMDALSLSTKRRSFHIEEKDGAIGITTRKKS